MLKEKRGKATGTCLDLSFLMEWLLCSSCWSVVAHRACTGDFPLALGCGRPAHRVALVAADRCLLRAVCCLRLTFCFNGPRQHMHTSSTRDSRPGCRAPTSTPSLTSTTNRLFLFPFIPTFDCTLKRSQIPSAYLVKSQSGNSSRHGAALCLGSTC